MIYLQALNLQKVVLSYEKNEKMPNGYSVIRSRKSNRKSIQWPNRQTLIYKTLHGKLKNGHHEYHKQLWKNWGAPAGWVVLLPLVAIVVLLLSKIQCQIINEERTVLWLRQTLT